MSFLEQWQRKQQQKPGKPTEDMLRNEDASSLGTLARGKRVVVLGGGDTGVDCIATATRQVCSSYFFSVASLHFIQKR